MHDRRTAPGNDSAKDVGPADPEERLLATIATRPRQYYGGCELP